MPPVNTPAAPSPTRSPSRPLTPFTYLSSPAPDLASTLHTHTASASSSSFSSAAADEANTDFLRTSLDALETLARGPSQAQNQRQTQTQRPPAAARTAPAAAFLDPRRDPRLTPTADDLSRRERLQRVLARLNRAHEPAAAAAASEEGAYGDRTPSPRRQRLYDWAPGAGGQDREAGEGDGDGEGGELDAILAELRRQQPEAGASGDDALRLFGGGGGGGNRRARREGSPARAASYMRVNGTVETYEQMSERRRRERQSLRNRVLLQRARQEASPSGTERMLRYVVERERSGMSEEEERARGDGWFGSATGRLGAEGERLDLPPMHELDRLERVETFRRGFLAEQEQGQARLPPVWSGASSSGASSAASTVLLENALKYLRDLRSARSYEDSLATAIANNLATKEFFADKHEDFMLDLDDIEPPAPSSWLQPGAVFQGHQHASSASMNITHQRHTQPGTHVEQINPNYRQSEHSSSTRSIGSFDASRPWLSHQIPPAPRPPAASPTPTDPANDHWPVRVTIHNIDWEKMTIQGTMEAYDVPQHPASAVNILNPGAAPEHRPKAGKKSAPITTYLEGHILDHHTHSFLTPPSPSSPKDHHAHTLADAISFPSATAPLDAQNWLALPPFNALSQPSPTTTTTKPPTPPPTAPSTLARLLLSRSQLRQLGSEYIFMRWKERCFVHSRHDGCPSSSSDRLGDQDRGHGLTISGFYYVSLRRRDGHVEGLYFDPSSTPYQLLRLRGRGGGWGSFEMR